MITQAEKTQKDAARKVAAETAFNKFMDKQETKLIVSMLPPATPPEALPALLRMAFDSGSDFGAGDIAFSFLDAMLKAPPKVA